MSLSNDYIPAIPRRNCALQCSQVIEMLPPEAEARFRKIEDELIVAAEILRRFEMRTEERVGYLEAVQEDYLEWRREHLQWTKEMDLNVRALIEAQLHTEQAVRELSATVERFLKSRMNGGGNS